MCIRDSLSFNYILYASILALSLSVGSAHMSNLFRKKDATLILLTIALIALTCILPKIFETLLNSHFLDHLESHSLLSDCQYGFRRSRSTGDILSYLTDLWFSTLRNYGETCVVALDISKAFERVWHASLLSKLPSFGFPLSLCLNLSSLSLIL